MDGLTREWQDLGSEVVVDDLKSNFQVYLLKSEIRFGCGAQKRQVFVARLRVVLRSGFVRTGFEARINRARSIGTAEYHAAGAKKA